MDKIESTLQHQLSSMSSSASESSATSKKKIRASVPLVVRVSFFDGGSAEEGLPTQPGESSTGSGELLGNSQMSERERESPTPLPENGDLGKYINSVEALSNSEKYQLLTQPFVPSKQYKFPQFVKYRKKRSFQLSWLEKYNGLVYSPFLGGGLCKYCVLFAKSRQSLGTFVISPFCEFWKASEKLKQHFGKEGEKHIGMPCKMHLSLKV